VIPSTGWKDEYMYPTPCERYAREMPKVADWSRKSIAQRADSAVLDVPGEPWDE
jgi:hypothetical protein